MLRSRFCIRRLMPCENGVSTTHGMSGDICFTAYATSKASLSTLPGIHITRSYWVTERASSASSIVDTWVNEGGYRSPNCMYSEKIFSSTRPSSSSMKASYGLAIINTLKMRRCMRLRKETSFRLSSDIYFKELKELKTIPRASTVNC